MHWEPPWDNRNHFARQRSSLKTTSCSVRCCAFSWKRAVIRSSSESAEAAELVLDKNAGVLSLMLTDVQLAGRMNGVELAHVAKDRNPRLDVVVTSGRPLMQPLPDGAKFWAKPWAPLDVLREAELAQLS